MPFHTGLLKNTDHLDNDGYISGLLSAVAVCTEDMNSGKNWAENVQNLLEYLGRLTKVSRVWIFQLMSLSETQITQDYIFEWASKPEYVQISLSRFRMFTNAIGNAEYRNLIESRKKGEWQSIVTSQLQPGFLKKDMRKQRIKSMLTVPLFVEGRWWGVLGLDDCDRDYEWSQVEISLLRIGAAFISAAVLNNRIIAYREQFSVLQDISENSIWSVDLATWHVRISSSKLASLDCFESYCDLPVRKVLKMIHVGDRRQLIKRLRSLATSETRDIRQDLRLRIGETSNNWIELIGRVSTDKLGRPIRFAGIAIDIMNRKMEEERLRKEAFIDPLTNILNRRGLTASFETRMNTISTRNTFSILLMDIDFFKLFNDEWGHDAGDAVLVHLVDVVKNILREKDLFVRYGGEEFLLLLPDVDNDFAVVIGHRIQTAIKTTPCQTGKNSLSVTVSIGCATSIKGQASLDEIITVADKALYKAKNSGRNKLFSDTL